MDATKAKALVKKLKRGKQGWSMTLPEDAGTCLGQRIKVSVCTDLPLPDGEPPLTDEEVALLEAIFLQLPKLSARAEKAWKGYAAKSKQPTKRDNLRPTIWIDREDQAGKFAGAWTLVIALTGTDYGWHVEFSGTKFKEIWAGD